MANDRVSSQSASATRRDFLKTSSLVVAGGAVASSLVLARSAHAAGSDILKIGLIGCGGRGTGAARDALSAEANVKLVAMGDTFADRLKGSLENLKKSDVAAKVDVAADKQFVGFDAYQKVIDSGVDVVLLTTPPHFRPQHFKAAVDAGKHVFCEKPVAVDGPGIRSVLQTVEEAKKKNLAVVSGLCWRYDSGMRETFKRIVDGQIGDILSMQVTYNTGGLWKHPRQPQWSDMEWQLRNWLYFTWLSGDHIVEQHVHSIDKAGWAMKEEPPVRATGLGGRQVRTSPEYGHIFDHHAVIFEYANGTRLYSFCRQQDGCAGEVNDYFCGTKGRADAMKNSITGENSWRYRGPSSNMYQVEHQELFASIRSGNPINNGLYMSRSSLMAIMGRMATYTGQVITWDQALNSSENLSPTAYEWSDLKMPPVPMPGITNFA